MGARALIGGAGTALTVKVLTGVAVAAAAVTITGAATTGSLNPAGPWTPHPENTSLRTLERLIDALRQVVSAAEDVGIPLAIEGAVVSPLDTPERVRDVIEAVDSPGLRFNSDPVNFVGSLPDIYNSLRHLFGLAFGYIMLAELINAQHGLGYLLMTSQRRGLSEHIILILLIIGLLAYGIDRLLFWFQRGLFPHRVVED